MKAVFISLLPSPGGGGGGGGGHCLFEGSYLLPNYPPRFSRMFTLEFSFIAPYFCRPQPSKIILSQCKILCKGDLQVFQEILHVINIMFFT